MDYWEECIAEAFEDAKIEATEKQIDTVASWIEGAHENYGMAHGHDCIPNPLEAENKKLATELKREQDKMVCKDCQGRGYFVENYGTRSAQHDCIDCNGKGFIYMA